MYKSLVIAHFFSVFVIIFHIITWFHSPDVNRSLVTIAEHFTINYLKKILIKLKENVFNTIIDMKNIDFNDILHVKNT